MTELFVNLNRYRDKVKTSGGDFTVAAPVKLFEKASKTEFSKGAFRALSLDGSKEEFFTGVCPLPLPCFVQRVPAVQASARYTFSSRDPFTGENVLTGSSADSLLSNLTLEQVKQLHEVGRGVEYLLEDVFDVEVMDFDGALVITNIFERPRTRAANAVFAHDMALEGLISGRDAILKISAADVPGLLAPTFKLDNAKVLMQGTPACAGAITGTLITDIAQAKNTAEPILLVDMTTPEDVAEMTKCKAILTTTGGLSSHAAIIARGYGIPCIVSVKAPENWKNLSGESVSIEGALGMVYSGHLPLTESTVAEKVQSIMEWAKAEVPHTAVYANADTAEQVKESLAKGAKGIGLVRTEHMLFTPEATAAFQKWVVGEGAIKSIALKELRDIQYTDFVEIFRAAAFAFSATEIPVTVRLLDPPLHEFMPDVEDTAKVAALAKAAGVTPAKVKAKLLSLHEHNPMLGHRGVRLGITDPDLYAAQVQAIAQAAAKIVSTTGKCVSVRVMLPLVSDPAEFHALAQMTREVLAKSAAGVASETGKIYSKVGVMLETPRACLVSDELVAAGAEFFSFGTNDLTQMTYGFSRDDVSKFMPQYLEKECLENDPFNVLDDRGVLRLMKIAMEQVREAKKGVSIGVCGEHGGEPRSITAALRLGVDYVSCSPARIPVALLASAQTVIADENAKGK